MPYDVFIESEKRPQVTVDADRVEKADGYINFYSNEEMIASFKEEKVVGYVKMVLPAQFGAAEVGARPVR